MTTPLTDAPIRSSLLLALKTQETLLQELFSSLPAGGGDAPALHAAIVASSASLDTLAAEAEDHQRRWAQLINKKKQVEGLERRIRELVRSLEGNYEQLEGMVDEGRKLAESIEKSEISPAAVPVLLAHAHALSRTTSAPVSSLLAPLDKAQATPWPNEMNMRQGLLFQLEGTMSGMGNVGVVGKEQPEFEKKEERAQVVEDTGRRYDPGAIFSLDLNSDESDSD